jgi:hypothetical protein
VGVGVGSGVGVGVGVGTGVGVGVGSGVGVGVGSGVGVGVGVASVQFSEYVLLDEIEVLLSLLTAKTTRMPPELTVNGLVTLMDHGTTVPVARLLPSKVIVASFLVTLEAGFAFDPLLGTM